MLAALFLVDAAASATAAVSTIAGQCGRPGYRDGPALVSLFNHPSRLQAVSVAGIERLYVLDDNNGCVRSMPLGLPPNGTVVRSETLCSDASTLAHVGPDAKFPNGTTRGWQHIDGPQGFWVAPDAKMLFVLDTDNNRVKVAHRSPGGNYTPWAVLAGSGAVGHSDGAAANASFSQPHGLSVAPRAGFVLVGDTFASCIRAVRISDGAVSTIAGRCGWGGHQDVPRGGDALSARFNHPHEVTVDPRNESIVYVSDVECFDDQPVQLASLNERHHCGESAGTNEEKFFTGVRKLELAYDGKGAVSVVSVSTVAGFFNASTPSRDSSNNIGMGDGPLTSGRFHYVHGVAIRPRSSSHDDFYKDMRATKELHDMSNFDPSSEFYDDTNKKVLGKFKDECDGKPPSEFVELRPKMYSLL